VENLQTNEDPLCEQLSQKFHIAPFFWTKTAWDANGFYRSRDNPLGGEHVIGSHSECNEIRVQLVVMTLQALPFAFLSSKSSSLSNQVQFRL